MKAKKDYHRKDFNNPFFPKKSKISAGRKAKILVGLVLGLILIAVYLFNRLPALQITNIEIAGNDYASTEEIKALVDDQMNHRRWLFFNQHNILFFSKSQLRQKLDSYYLLERIKIKKRYFSGLDIEITERPSGLVWSSDNKYYYLDLSGKVLREIQPDNVVIVEGQGTTNLVRNQAESVKYPLVTDLSNSEVFINQQAASEKLIRFVLGFSDLITRSGDFVVSHYEIFKSNTREIEMVTKAGWRVKLNIEETPESQAELLLAVLQQRVKDRNNLEYIDLRFGDKIFWK
ncbi:MAG: FtsQ-type POTRA domain-containing protein [Patescibacteria group bacterium]|jgi:cell division septal protein FtsQ|nr:FtsQ-type POTRA domain-containing protein [Patescibacteria group bacterium]